MTDSKGSENFSHSVDLSCAEKSTKTLGTSPEELSETDVFSSEESKETIDQSTSEPQNVVASDSGFNCFGFSESLDYIHKNNYETNHCVLRKNPSTKLDVKVNLDSKLRWLPSTN